MPRADLLALAALGLALYALTRPRSKAGRAASSVTDSLSAVLTSGALIGLA